MVYLTDGKDRFEKATKKALEFRKAAIADGWEIRPIYEGYEPVEKASKLYRDGFLMMIFTREKEVEISVWGNDGLCIVVPEEYSFEKIKEGMTFCDNCKATGVKTVRYSFAGRCCNKCLPEMRKKHEYPGWDR